MAFSVVLLGGVVWALAILPVSGFAGAASGTGGSMSRAAALGGMSVHFAATGGRTSTYPCDLPPATLRAPIHKSDMQSA